MSSQKVWNFWAPRYKNLWVQKVSLKPTRETILELMVKLYPNSELKSYLDVGCGVGELIADIEAQFKTEVSFGLDYSEKMIDIASELGLKTMWFNQDIHDFKFDTQVDLILCTHSFPYYKDQKAVLKTLRKTVKKDGRVLMAFASKNSFYDGLCMSVVKFTTGKASYPSVMKFIEMASDDFIHISMTRIKEKWYMPSIYLFEMEPRHE